MLPIFPMTTWIAGAAAAAFAVVAGLQTVRLAHEEADHSKTVAAFEQEKTKAANETTRANQAERLLEQAYQKGKDDAVTEAQSKIAAAAADARSAQRAADGLRGRVATLESRARAACKDPVPAGGSATTDDPIGVLAHVLRSADARAGVLASYADSARIAGQTCERIHDSLTAPIVSTPVPAAANQPAR